MKTKKPQLNSIKHFHLIFFNKILANSSPAPALKGKSPLGAMPLFLFWRFAFDWNNNNDSNNNDSNNIDSNNIDDFEYENFNVIWYVLMQLRSLVWNVSVSRQRLQAHIHMYLYEHTYIILVCFISETRNEKPETNF